MKAETISQITEAIPQITETLAQMEETVPEITEIIPQVTEAVTQMSNTIQQAVASGIDWNEIIYVLVGAVIGFVGSIVVMLAERALDRKGTIQIFYRRTSQRGLKKFGWGFDKTGDGRLYLTIPVVFEIQNTSNTTRVIRDVSLLLYRGNTFVGKMYQSAGKHVTTRTNNTVTDEKDYTFGAEKGSYSFVLQPRSIQRQECEYSYVIYANEKEEKVFDTIIARYYDERNRSHMFRVMTIEKAWDTKYFDPDQEWCVLDETISLPPC